MLHRSLKWRVTYRIDVHTMPDSFSGRHEKLNLSGSDSPPHGNRRLEATAEAKLASHADVLRGSSRVPAPRMSADLSGKKRRPITADFQIWEVHFGP